MRHSLWRGLKKWKGDSYFQFIPVLTGGGADLMTMAPSAAAGIVLDQLTPQRFQKEEEVVLPERTDGLTIADISDPVVDSAPGVETRIIYVNGDLDMLIEVRNYNEGVSIKDMPAKEFLQRLATGVDVEAVEDRGTEVQPRVEVF